MSENTKISPTYVRSHDQQQTACEKKLMGVSSETKHLVVKKVKSEKNTVDEESVTDEEVSEFARVFAQLRGGRDWD